MQAIFTIAFKDLRLLWRDKPGLFWVLIFPILTALFFGSMFGGMGEDEPKSMRIAVVAEPGSPIAGQLYAALDSSDLIETVPMTLDSARRAVQRGRLAGYVDVRSQAQSSVEMFAESTIVDIGIDPTRKMEAGLLEGLVNQAYFKILQQSMSDPAQLQASMSQLQSQLDSALADPTDSAAMAEIANNKRWLEFMGGLDTLLAATRQTTDTAKASTQQGAFGNLRVKLSQLADDRAGPRSGYDITFPQAIQWALIGTAAAFGISVVVERTRGTWLRLRLSPLSRSQILAGKGLACFLACMTVSTFLLTLGVLIFRVQISNFPMLAAAVIASSLCFVGLMMFMSVLGKTENAVAGAGWAIFMVSSMLGGGMIPLMFMPAWITPASNFSPVKWSIMAMEGAIWRGFGWSEMALPLGILCGIGLVGYLIGVRILSQTD